MYAACAWVPKCPHESWQVKGTRQVNNEICDTCTNKRKK